MTSMVERVARAICLADGLDDGLSNAFAVQKTDREWGEWVPLARAAIEAMREPTPEMVEAGAGYHEAWPFMIDAALVDKI